MCIDYDPEMYIEVFEKNADEKIEEAILNLIKQEGKDPNNCKVEKFNTLNGDNQEYIITLSKPISYTASELEEISLADKNWTPDAGPVNGEFKKMEINNKRIIESCSEYADPLGLGTSKSLRSTFLYNENSSKTKFVFLPGSYNPYFFEEDTIEFINE